MSLQENKPYLSCPLTKAMDILGGKWKILILGQLFTGCKRFSELKKAIPGVTQKMLTQQLRELETEGLIHREIFKEIPPRVEYSLTQNGSDLKPIFDELCKWGKKLLAR